MRSNIFYRKRAFIVGCCLGVLLPLFISEDIQSQPPAGYYNSAQGINGLQLKAALHNITDSHLVQDYSLLHQLFKSTDSKPDSTVWDMYSDIPGSVPPYVFHFVASEQCGNYSQEGDCYNKEHSFPKSWFGGDIYPMYSDLFQLYPTDGYVNSIRGNLPYGTVGSSNYTSMNGSKRGVSSAAGYTGQVFEPINAYKGDFARTYFYMAVRYYTEDTGWPGSPMVNGAEPLPWALTMLMQWHNADTVSTKEINRNNAVYAIQNNRNPFIDHPEYVNLIWGIPSGLGQIQENPLQAIAYPNPFSDLITVDIPSYNGSEELHYTVADMTGRIQASGSFMATPLHLTGFTEFPCGIYFLRIKRHDGSEKALKLIHSR